MKKITLFFLCTFSAVSLMAGSFHQYDHAIVRGLSPAFEESLKREQPENAIDITLAQEQHRAYTSCVTSLINDTQELPADPNHPDCNFIEDTALLIGDQAIICNMGADSRQGEEIEVERLLKTMNLKTVTRISSPARIDGGDVLYTGDHLLVGLSSRTNEMAIEQLRDILRGQLPVVALHPGDTLHLKSLVTQIAPMELVVADDLDGRNLVKEIESQGLDYRILWVPDRVAANIVRINDHLLIQKGFPESERILRKRAEEEGLTVHPLAMSELIKADGALTCGSLLF